MNPSGQTANGAPSVTAEDFYNQVAPAEPAGFKFLDHDNLFVVDPPNENLVVPALGIGSGPVSGLIGEGYVGKTFLAMEIGMAVALGKMAWGKYPTKQGVWVHFDYEQGRRHTKRRIQRLANGFGASKEDLRGRIKIAVFPEIDLTTKDALKHYVVALTGAAIATVDSLSCITPGADENKREMRDLIKILSKASDETGCAVTLIHHAGLPSAGRERKNMGRGSSSIYQEFQSQFSCSGKKGEPILVTHDKDRELGYTVPAFKLRIEDVALDADSKWGIRVVLDAEVPENGEEVSFGASPRQQAKEAAKATKEAAKALNAEMVKAAREKERLEREQKHAQEMRQRNEEDDAAVRVLLAEMPDAPQRDLTAHVKERRGCGTERAVDAIKRVKGTPS